MKKYIYLFLFLIVSIFYACTSSKEIENDLKKAYQKLDIPDYVENHLSLPSSITIQKKEIHASYSSSNEEILNSKTGEVLFHAYEQKVSLTIELSYRSSTYTETKGLTIAQKTGYELMSYTIEKLTLPSSGRNHIELPSVIDYYGKDYSLSYAFSDPSLISKNGDLQKVYSDTPIQIIASFSIFGDTVYKEFDFIILASTNLELMQETLKSVQIPSYTNTNLLLPTSFSNGMTASWESSNLDVLSSSGDILKNGTATLTITLASKKEILTKDYSVSVYSDDTLYTNRSFVGTRQNVTTDGTGLVLKDSEVEGSYTTEEIVVPFQDCFQLMGSWNATTSSKTSVEYTIRMKINGSWSSYFSYGEFGLGKENKEKYQSDPKACIDGGFVSSLSSGSTGRFQSIQIKMILRRDSSSIESPKLHAIYASYILNSYSYKNTTTLKNSVFYEVPKLYQNVVPGIGNSICSPTTSTMLLKYYGHDFSEYDTYEHRYIAGLFRDYGNNIYGNWVYNVAGIGSYEEIAFAKYVYSIDELKYYLSCFGPIGISVGGTITSNITSYYTPGHLMVLTGYYYDNGVLMFYVNDPNVQKVSVIMTGTNLKNCFASKAYVVIPKA